jgi:hypothetical protein
MVGRTLSHYKVLEELSCGGMGIVYRALRNHPQYQMTSDKCIDR